MTNTTKTDRLEQQAKRVREKILYMIYTAASGHPGGSLSAADIMTVLYFDELKVDPRNPKWDDRDRFVLSKGHACPVLYACLALRGYFDVEELGTLRCENSILQGHPDMKRCPGIDISTGSLGQGVSAAVGMALRAKRDGKNYRTFVLLGDGETQEGEVWEAVEAAVKYRLDNLVLIVDNNGMQNDNRCEVVMPLGILADKFSAFGCAVHCINGNCMSEVLDVFDKIRGQKCGKPICIIAKTVKGKGVSFMENVCMWHGAAPNEEQYRQALRDIEDGI